MSIRRGERPADHFTIIANGLLRDPRLSFKARGLAAYLLSHAEGFRSTADSIAKANHCGLDQVRSALQELEQRGYLRRERNRDEAGHNTDTDYLITDCPEEEESLHRETQRRETQRWETRPHKKTKGLEDQVTPSTSTIAGATADEDQLPLVEAGVEPGTDEPQRPEVEALCTRLVDHVKRNGGRRATVSKAWRDAARLLLDRDKAPLNQVTYVLDWCQKDEFWRTNILSMPKFRQQYDQLAMKCRQDVQRRRNGQVTGRDVQDMKAATAARRAAMNVDGDF